MSLVRRTLPALVAATLALPALASAQQARMGTKSPALLRADAPPASPVANPPYDPNDPSLALAFNSVVNGVNLNGVGQLWTPIPNDPNGFYATCTVQRIGPVTLITAAHCVTDELNGSIFSPQGAFARFLGPGSTASARAFTSFDIRNIVVQSDWFGFDNPKTNLAHDVAVLTTKDVLPNWVTSYNLFTDDPWGQPTVNVGYGTFGTGTGVTNFDSRRRWGTNQVDFVSGGILFTDFDDGSAMWDSNCLAIGICGQGLPTEAGVAAGDSGGPLFIGGKLAGITSFGTYWCADNDCHPYSADPSRPFDAFGALNGFSSVGVNLGFIQASTVPEPTTMALTAIGLLALVGITVRRRTA